MQVMRISVLMGTKKEMTGTAIMAGPSPHIPPTIAAKNHITATTICAVSIFPSQTKPLFALPAAASYGFCE